MSQATNSARATSKTAAPKVLRGEALAKAYAALKSVELRGIVWATYEGRRIVIRVDILPALKDGDSSCETAMPGRKNVPGSVYVSVMYRTTIAARPLSYSKACSTFRTAVGQRPTARTSLGCVRFVHFHKDDAGRLALVFQRRL